MKLIIGLGNPGDKYTKVRHNLGFLVLDEYAKMYVKSEIAWEGNTKLKSQILKLDQTLWLVKPQTFMNNSGMAVSELVNYYKVVPEDIIIVHDELDLPLGKIKVRIGGAAAGHHGVESVIDKLGTDQFIRVRLGIGNLRSMSGERKGTHFNAEHYILEPFMPNERSKVKHMVKQAVSAIETLLEKGLESAQNQYN